GGERPEPIARVLILDPESGSTVGRREVRIPPNGGEGEIDKLDARAVSDGYLFFVSRRKPTPDSSSNWSATAFHLDRNLSDPKPLGQFRWLSGRVEPTLAGDLIATPLQVFATKGSLLAEFKPFLSGKAWSGKKLVGLRDALFIGATVLPQAGVPRHPFGSVQ